MLRYLQHKMEPAKLMHTLFNHKLPQNIFVQFIKIEQIPFYENCSKMIQKNAGLFCLESTNPHSTFENTLDFRWTKMCNNIDQDLRIKSFNFYFGNIFHKQK